MEKNKIIILCIGVLAGFLVWLSLTAGLFRGLENFFEDLFFSPKPVSQNLVIVAIDSESISRIGQWPWPRSVLAETISKLNTSFPKALGIDIVLADSSRYGSSDDTKLSSTFDKVSYPIILSAEASPLIINSDQSVRAGKLIEPLDIFKNHPNISVGHVNLIADQDGIVRSFPKVISAKIANNNEEIYALAYEVFNKSSQSGTVNKTDSASITRIYYSAPTGSIRRIPFYRVLDGSAKDLLKNKIILLGVTSADLHDSQPTPLSRGTEMPGVEIQGNIINMFLQGYYLRQINPLFQFIWIIISALISSLIFLYFSSRRVFLPIISNIIFGIIHTVLIVILFERGIASNFLHINFAWILSTGSIFSYRYFTTERDRLNLKNVFSKYVSKDILEEILRDPTKVKLGGEEKEVTVFFSDIRGFTTLSEKMPPDKLVKMLNRYFTIMTNQILKHGGVIDKYIGDAIMAFWGAPIGDPDSATHALEASIEMLSELKKFNSQLQEEGEQPINIGIGLYTGPVIVGNVGSESRFDYTIIGDTVNVSSRLEGLNKEYKTNIIIGETTKNKLIGGNNLKFLGSVSVKGRKELLNIYTIM